MATDSPIDQAAETIDENNQAETIGRATYSPEDNKLRLYPRRRLAPDIYQLVKDAGFRWAPKQGLFVAPKWSPAREDLLIELCDEIEDEDYSPEERAADRAERFGQYRDKRHAEAIAGADRFESGPAVFGHQSAARASRQARRFDRVRLGAVSQWRKAEYWQARTEGVIASARHKSSAKVRRSRILTLEAELRRWANSPRYAEHLQNRLTYERAMLAQEGGSAADLEIIPGGFFGSSQVYGVNRSPVTGRVVSVKVFGRPWWKSKSEAVSLMSVNIERLGEAAYRAPTAEELAEFNAKQAEEKKAAKKAKAAAPKGPQLINPTEADAERLQALMNAAATKRNKNAKPVEVVRMTQAQYSAVSGGTYARYTTAEISEKLTERDPYRIGDDKAGRKTIFKIRLGGSSDLYGARRVVVLTDKPQKPLPWDAVEKAAAESPTKEKLFPRLPEIAAIIAKGWAPQDGTPEQQLFADARYVGWAYKDSESQFGFLAAGHEAMAEYKAAQAAETVNA